MVCDSHWDVFAASVFSNSGVVVYLKHAAWGVMCWTLLDLKNLLEASTKYLKFTSSSKAPTWIMCVNSYFNYQFPNQSGKVKIKVSTYHDVKEVKWNRAEKQAEVCRKLLVMGTKMKEENWKDQ